MPEKRTVERARKEARAGKSPTTQAGEFVREEIHHVREGKHGARSPQQAIAIGLSKARRAGVKLGPPPREPATLGDEGRAGEGAFRAPQGRAESRSDSPGALGSLVIDVLTPRYLVRQVPAKIDLGGNELAVADGMYFAVAEGSPTAGVTFVDDESAVLVYRTCVHEGVRHA